MIQDDEGNASSYQTNEKVPKHEKLYNLAKIKNQKKAELERKKSPIFGFKPKVNKSEITATFQQRLDYYNHKKEEKQQQVFENLKNPLDQRTGQRLFSPNLISKKTYNSNNERVGMNYGQPTANQGSRLYSYAAKFQANLNEKSNEVEQLHHVLSNRVNTCSGSNNIYNNRKESSFKEIFSILDGDREKVISTYNLKTKNLPENINKILNPIYKEIREDNETLTKDEFVRAMNHLFDVIILLKYAAIKL